MCGICGFLDFKRELNGGDGLILEKMTDRLTHRGPDGRQHLLLGNLAFGFNRLSIIGLANGMQPIRNEDGTLILVCNGEIFNYIELKGELIKKGHVFRTDSDVEVILHLYEDLGKGLLDRLNGQFAFALFDLRNKLLFCARDHMGILPFFYTIADGTFIFGSEIKAILEHPSVKTDPDPVGLDQIMTFAGLISPRTMFKNIHSLENGHCLTIDENGNLRKEEYWDLIYPLESEKPQTQPEAYYIGELERLFEQSVRLRLRADVPSGFYLSGGLDSSMVAMKISQIVPAGNKEAFAIDFVESDISETFYQKLVAARSHAILHQKTFYSDDISERLRTSVYHSECPVKETYNTASLYLSGKVRERGIKVILSGEGADEFFAGYIGYRFDKMREMGFSTDVADAEEKKWRKATWGDEDFFYETDFSRLNAVKRSLYSRHLSSAFDEINCLHHPVVNTKRLSGRSRMDKRSYVDYKLRLTDHLVSDHGDRMAMANSVEVRYPFLDRELVEFSTRVPGELKLCDLTEKYILKKMAQKFVPSEVCNREKFGFVAPGSPFLLQRGIEYINDLLSYDRIRRQGYFDPDRVEQLKRQCSTRGYSINVPFESDLLLIVITFGIFLDHFFDA